MANYIPTAAEQLNRSRPFVRDLTPSDIEHTNIREDTVIELSPYVWSNAAMRPLRRGKNPVNIGSLPEGVIPATNQLPPGARWGVSYQAPNGRVYDLASDMESRGMNRALATQFAVEVAALQIPIEYGVILDMAAERHVNGFAHAALAEPIGV